MNNEEKNKKVEKIMFKIIPIIILVTLITGVIIFVNNDSNYISLENVKKEKTFYGYKVIDEWETTVYAAGKVAKRNLGYYYRVSFKHKNGELYYSDVHEDELKLYSPGDKIKVTTYVYTTKKGLVINIEHKIKK